MLTKKNSKNKYNANQIKKAPKQSNKDSMKNIKNKTNTSLEISNNYLPINYNQNEQSYIDNGNRIKKNLNYYYADNNISNNKRKIKRTTPDIIYNRKPQNSPIKNTIKGNSIKYPFYNPNNSFNNIQYIPDNNNNNSFLHKNADQYNYSTPSFILSKNKSYKISPQNELNIEIIQQKNAINNNNYYNIKFNKINNTENNYYKGRIIDYSQYRNNYYHKIEMGNNTYERSKSPQTSNIIKDNRLNYDDNNYNKTSTNFNIPKQMKQTYNYERNKENRFNNQNINKYNNHKQIEIIYSNNENQYKNIYSNRGFFQNIDNIENNNNYNNINDYNNYNNSPDIINQLNESNIRDDKINLLNNSVDNNLSYDLERLENNQKPKEGLKKNKSVFINNDISPQIRDNNNNNYNQHNNNDIKEIRHNKISYKNISPREQSFSNKKYKNNYNNENSKEKLPKNNILFKKKPIKENSNINKDLNKSKILHNKEFEICKNNSFNYENINNDKIIFDNEDNIIEYINKKYEEDKKKTYFNRKIKFTGFILTKKYKGKNLYDIRIEDDIDKINQRLKEENVEVNNELIEIIPINKNNNNNINNNNSNNNEDNKNKDIINNLENEISKYKEKNESLTKKDILKNQLIKKLDYEKQNLIEENKKLSNDIEQIKKLNVTLNEEYQKLKKKNNVYTDFNNYKIENPISMDIHNKIKNIAKSDDIQLKEEKMDISNINNNNVSTINNNIINGVNNKADNNDNKDSNIKNDNALMNE